MQTTYIHAQWNHGSLSPDNSPGLTDFRTFAILYGTKRVFFFIPVFFKNQSNALFAVYLLFMSLDFYSFTPSFVS